MGTPSTLPEFGFLTTRIRSMEERLTLIEQFIEQRFCYLERIFGRDKTYDAFTIKRGATGSRANKQELAERVNVPRKRGRPPGSSFARKSASQPPGPASTKRKPARTSAPASSQDVNERYALKECLVRLVRETEGTPSKAVPQSRGGSSNRGGRSNRVKVKTVEDRVERPRRISRKKVEEDDTNVLNTSEPFSDDNDFGGINDDQDTETVEGFVMDVSEKTEFLTSSIKIVQTRGATTCETSSQDVSASVNANHGQFVEVDGGDEKVDSKDPEWEVLEDDDVETTGDEEWGDNNDDEKHIGTKKSSSCRRRKRSGQSPAPSRRKRIRPKYRNSRITNLPAEGKVVSSDPTRSECSICHKHFKNEAMAQHLNSHAKERHLECPDCGKMFFSTGSLVNHSAIHSPNKYGRGCRVCGKFFVRSSKTLAHERICVRKAVEKNETIDPEIIEDIQKRSLHGFTLPGPNPVEQDPDKKKRCPHCSKHFRLHFFEKHMKSHLLKRNWKCSMCDKAYIHKHDLVRHMVATHKSGFKCNACHVNFGSEVGLEEHDCGKGKSVPISSPTSKTDSRRLSPSDTGASERSDDFEENPVTCRETGDGEETPKKNTAASCSFLPTEEEEEVPHPILDLVIA